MRARLVPSGRALVTLTAVVGSFAWFAPAAEATFPGSNGRIAYTWVTGPGVQEEFSGPGFVGVVSVRPDGTGRQLIARKGAFPGYSPDGRRIAFIRAHRLWVARADGKGARPVTPKGLLVEDYEWSPHGDRLAVTREFKTVSAGWLYSVRPNGRDLERLATSPAGIRLFPGAWSPDGKAIVFERQRNPGRAIVQIARGGRIVRHGVGIAPTWSMQGLIAYEPRNLKGIYRVCATRPLRASKPVRCFGGRGRGANGPTWSPDGSRLMFTITQPTGAGSSSELLTARMNGTIVTRISADLAHSPTFSPDGRWLLSVDPAGQPPRVHQDLYLTHPDGTGRRLVVRGGFAATQDWQPRPHR
jgi:Tol biopolymer transport system component